MSSSSNLARWLASDMAMRRVLIMLTLTVIQGRTDVKREINKCLIISETVSSIAHQVCCWDSPTKSLHNLLVRWPCPSFKFTTASQTWLLCNLQYLRQYLLSYYIQTWHDARLITHRIHALFRLTLIVTLMKMFRKVKGGRRISDVSPLSAISGLPVWSHLSISPLFFCLVLSLFLSLYPFLLLAYSPDLFFPKPPFSER